MQTIGLIGGMSWESSLEYYRIINETVKRQLGSAHSAKCILYSVDFAEIEQLQHQAQWETLTRKMIQIAKSLEKAGADLILICTNTMHLMAEAVQENINIPLLHIVDVTAEHIKKQKLEKVGLLGTKFTMEEEFYRGRLANKYGLEIIIPEPRAREYIHNAIYCELCQGKINSATKKEFIKIISIFSIHEPYFSS